MCYLGANSRLARQPRSSRTRTSSRTITIEERKRFLDRRGRDFQEMGCSLARFSFLAIVPQSYSSSNSSSSDPDSLRTKRKRSENIKGREPSQTGLNLGKGSVKGSGVSQEWH